MYASSQVHASRQAALTPQTTAVATRPISKNRRGERSVGWGRSTKGVSPPLYSFSDGRRPLEHARGPLSARAADGPVRRRRNSREPAPCRRKSLCPILRVSALCDLALDGGVPPARRDGRVPARIRAPPRGKRGRRGRSLDSGRPRAHRASENT